MKLTLTPTLMEGLANIIWTTLVLLDAPTVYCLGNTLRSPPPRTGGPSRVNSGGGGR